MTRRLLYVAIGALTLPVNLASPLAAKPQWQRIEASESKEFGANVWEKIPSRGSHAQHQVWEPLDPEEENQKPDQLVGTQAKPNESAETQTSTTNANAPGFRWPNGQLMSPEDQIYFRTAYSRGSMIQIGDTVYPNLGFNALQRKPGSFANLQISAIDDSWQVAPSPCDDNNFFDSCF